MAEATSLFELLATLWQLLCETWALRPAAFRTIHAHSLGDPLALTVLLLAGFSLMLGQSVVLFINQVNRVRFGLCLLVGVILFVISVCFWVASIWLSARFMLGYEQSWVSVMRAVSLAHAPLIFGVFVLLPYVGMLIYRVLYIWTLLAILAALMTTFQLNFAQALQCGLLGWVWIEALYHFAERPLHAFLDWSWRITTGKTTRISVEELVRSAIQRTSRFRQE